MFHAQDASSYSCHRCIAVAFSETGATCCAVSARADIARARTASRAPNERFRSTVHYGCSNPAADVREPDTTAGSVGNTPQPSDEPAVSRSTSHQLIAERTWEPPRT